MRVKAGGEPCLISAARFCKAWSAARTRSRSSTAICSSLTRSGIAIILNVADGLRELGLARGDRLLVVLQNRWEMATLHWACQFAGIVIVPLNWRAKPDELDYCVTDAGVKAIVYEPVCARCRRRRAPRRRTCRASDSTTRKAARRTLRCAAGRTRTRAQRARPHATADDYSLILYTSGTTGKAKGVPRRHRHERAAALAHVAQNLYRHGERTLGVMPLYHTMGVRSLLSMALVDGLFVCVRRWNARLALDSIAKHSADVPVSRADALSRPARRIRTSRDAIPRR